MTNVRNPVFLDALLEEGCNKDRGDIQQHTLDEELLSSLNTG
jgi:hypothetical protein